VLPTKTLPQSPKDRHDHDHDLSMPLHTAPDEHRDGGRGQEGGDLRSGERDALCSSDDDGDDYIPNNRRGAASTGRVIRRVSLSDLSSQRHTQPHSSDHDIQSGGKRQGSEEYVNDKIHVVRDGRYVDGAVCDGRRGGRVISRNSTSADEVSSGIPLPPQDRSSRPHLAPAPVSGREREGEREGHWGGGRGRGRSASNPIPWSSPSPRSLSTVVTGRDSDAEDEGSRVTDAVTPISFMESGSSDETEGAGRGGWKKKGKKRKKKNSVMGTMGVAA
jgi:hypothetical protein